MKAEVPRRRCGRGLILLCILPSAVILGCKSAAPAAQPSTKPSPPGTISERQDAAMKDPFGYSPWKKDEKSRVSGGGIGEYDKDGIKRDMKSVFDP